MQRAEGPIEARGGREPGRGRDPHGDVFYGWWIVGASFLILFVTVGIGLYAPPVFLVPLQEHFGWSRAAIAGGSAVAALASGLVAPLVGAAIDRYGSRRVMTLGALLMGASFTGFSLITRLWQLYALNLFGAVGISCVAWIPNQTLVANWFERRRGFAMGFALAGIGFGGFAMAPLTGLLIEAVGWRIAFAALGGTVLVVVTTTILVVVRTHPRDLGLEPDGAAAPHATVADPPGSGAPLPGLAVGAAVRTRAFGLLAGLHFLWVFGNLSIVAHLVAFLSDVGFAPQLASLTLGLVVLASVAGRLLFGAVADRFPKRFVLSLALFLHATATLCLFVIGSDLALPVFVTGFGLALGGAAVMIPLIVGECFGLRAFGQILGLVMIAATLGAAIGPVLTGRIFDVTGSYDLAFGLHATALAGAALLALLVKTPAGARAG